jgi:hypothetical protein
MKRNVLGIKLACTIFLQNISLSDKCLASPGPRCGSSREMSLTDMNQNRTVWENFSELARTRFNNNQFGGSSVVTCGQTKLKGSFLQMFIAGAI